MPTIEGLQMRLEGVEAAQQRQGRHLQGIQQQVTRLSTSIESFMRAEGVTPIEVPRPAPLPRSWHQELAQKQVSLRAAGAGATIVVLILELVLRALEHFW